MSQGTCLSAALNAEVLEETQAKTDKYALMFTYAYSSILCVQIFIYIDIMCIFLGLSPYSCLFSSMHAASLLPPALVSERDLRIGAGAPR